MGDEIEPKRDWHAEGWVPFIKRGASGRGPRGTESGGEYVLVEVAGTILPGGEPALMLIHRFSLDELAAVKRAMNLVGFDCWYHLAKEKNAPENKERRR
jgi:hypothetical protein